MSNLNSSVHIAYNQVKNATHTWVVIAGWSFDGRAGLEISSRSNTLIISYYDPFELASWCEENLDDYLTTPYSVLGFSLGALWLSHNQKLFSSALRRVFIGIRRSYTQDVISPVEAALQHNFRQCVAAFHNRCLSMGMRQNQMVLCDPEFITKPTLEKGLMYLKSFSFNTRIIRSTDSIIHGMLDKIAPFRELDFIDTNQLILKKKMGHLCLVSLDLLDV